MPAQKLTPSVTFFHEQFFHTAPDSQPSWVHSSTMLGGYQADCENPEARELGSPRNTGRTAGCALPVLVAKGPWPPGQVHSPTGPAAMHSPLDADTAAESVTADKSQGKTLWDAHLEFSLRTFRQG